MPRTLLAICLFGFASNLPAQAPSKRKSKAAEPDVVIPFKKIEGDSAANSAALQLHVFRPKGWKASDKRPAIVFFFGGGWVGGHPRQFFPFSRHLADRGMVSISAQYRTKTSHGTDPFACIADGKSAVRWVREHAAELGIDPKRIAAGGGSAGGHVAACTGVLKGLDDVGERESEISSKPNALVLFNPVMRIVEGKVGFKAFGSRANEGSPNAHVHADVPPTVLFHGTGDTTVPISQVREFQKMMKKLGRRCDLFEYEGRKHAFFNHGRKDYQDTVDKMDRFLVSLGYLAKPQQ